MKREANRLRMLRAERRVTQILLSRKTGLQPARISLIENGHVEPRQTERERIARALHVDVSDVFPIPDHAVSA